MVRIIEHAAATGAIMPNDGELARLMQIVVAAYPWLQGAGDDAFDLHQFKIGFIGQGRFYRVRETRRDRFFYSWIERTAELLDREIHGGAFLAACLAAGDVPVRLASPRHGQLLEVGFDEFRGATASNAWRTDSRERRVAADAFASPGARRLCGRRRWHHAAVFRLSR